MTERTGGSPSEGTATPDEDTDDKYGWYFEKLLDLLNLF